ncbi:hypothetical protein EGR_09621 [Echinococcus granulosus]|uniref:Fork-head domain-containing protein n=1 Tax=Echinococcus granulosus TaxID=6210 RepID=W6U323_ECHGR|nr:hypothetical protein EGR_09621 [Echinococcus granulosus]EUB55515.1 hypothetical protein EGR_09621 [Echinococcus granulosus]
MYAAAACCRRHHRFCFCCYYYDDSEAVATVVVVAVVRRCVSSSASARAYLRARVNTCVERRGADDSQNNSPIAPTSTRPHTHPPRLPFAAGRWVGPFVRPSAFPSRRAAVRCFGRLANLFRQSVPSRGGTDSDTMRASSFSACILRAEPVVVVRIGVSKLVNFSILPFSRCTTCCRCEASLRHATVELTSLSFWQTQSLNSVSPVAVNSIRHNLSLHDKFVKCPKASESSKSSYWRLNANSLNRPYVRRRTCSLDTSGSVAGGGGGGVGGKKAKSRLGGGGSGAASSASAAKRAAQIAAAATAAGGGGGGSGGRGEMKSGGALYGGDNLLSTLQSSGSSAAAVRSHLNSLSSGIVSAFSIPGGGGSDTLLGLKPDPGSGLNHHPWTNSGFLADRKPPNDEISALCKMQTSDSVSSGSLSLMSSGGGGGYEFQVPRPPPSSSTRSSFSSSGIGSDRGSSFFSPPPPPLPPQSSRYHHHQAFSQDQQQRYGSLCDASPTAASTSTTPTTTYDHLTGILTGSAECLDGGADPFLRDDPHQLQHHHQPPPPSMSHHHQHHHHHQHPPLPPPTNSHLHNLLMCGDSSGEVPGSALSSTIHGSGEQQQLLSSQDAMELRISLEIANRVKSGEMSSTMQQWAAVAASAARTVENGV